MVQRRLQSSSKLEGGMPGASNLLSYVILVEVRKDEYNSPNSQEKIRAHVNGRINN